MSTKVNRELMEYVGYAIATMLQYAYGVVILVLTELVNSGVISSFLTGVLGWFEINVVNTFLTAVAVCSKELFVETNTSSCQTEVTKFSLNTMIILIAAFTFVTKVLPKCFQMFNYVVYCIMAVFFKSVGYLIIGLLTKFKTFIVSANNLSGLHSWWYGVEVLKTTETPKVVNVLGPSMDKIFEGVTGEKATKGDFYLYKFSNYDFLVSIYEKVTGDDGTVLAHRAGTGFRIGDYYYTAAHVVDNIVTPYVASLDNPNCMCAVERAYDYELFEWETINDLARLKIGKSATVLGIKSGKFGIWNKLTAVSVLTIDLTDSMDKTKRVLASHTRLVKGDFQMKALYKNKSNTMSGDSGAPVMQNGYVVAMHVGGMNEEDFNVCILTSWNSENFEKACAAFAPLLPELPRFKALEQGKVLFEYVTEGKHINWSSSTSQDDDDHARAIKLQMEEAEAQKAERQRGKGVDEQGFRVKARNFKTALNERDDSILPSNFKSKTGVNWSDVQGESAQKLKVDLESELKRNAEVATLKAAKAALEAEELAKIAQEKKNKKKADLEATIAKAREEIRLLDSRLDGATPVYDPESALKEKAVKTAIKVQKSNSKEVTFTLDNQQEEKKSGLASEDSGFQETKARKRALRKKEKKQQKAAALKNSIQSNIEQVPLSKLS